MTEIPSPRETERLIGHEDAERRLLEAWSSGRLPHGWLITGPKGIGKATLAYRFARFLLVHGEAGGSADEGPSMFGDALPAAAPETLAVEASHPVFRRVASSGHADLQVLERGLADDGKRMQTVIPVEKVRVAGHAMSLTAGEGGWRIVIVDGAEDMNVNAANALLKLLEEPPPRAMLLLVSHAPGRLLPTIRSRCCRLRLSPLEPAALSELLELYRPDLPTEERVVLASLADGSIGRALSLADSDGLAIRRNVVGLIAGVPSLDMAAASKFADRIARRDADAAWHTATDLATRCLADIVGSGARGTNLAARGYTDPEAAALRRLGEAASLDRWVEVWEKTSRLFAQTDSASLDRKQAMLSALGSIENTARSGV